MSTSWEASRDLPVENVAHSHFTSYTNPTRTPKTASPTTQRSLWATRVPRGAHSVFELLCPSPEDLPRRSPLHNARHCWTLDHITTNLFRVQAVTVSSSSTAPFQHQPLNCTSKERKTPACATASTHTLPWRTQRRTSVSLAHTRFTSSFTLYTFSLASTSTIHPASSGRSSCARQPVQRLFLSSPLLILWCASILIGSLSRTCDTASFSELARRHNLRVFRHRIGSQSASQRGSRSRRVRLRVCLHSGHRHQGTHKCVPNTLRGMIGRFLGQSEVLCLWLRS